MASELVSVRFVDRPPCPEIVDAAREHARRLGDHLAAPLRVVVIVASDGPEHVRIRALGRLHRLSLEGRGIGEPERALVEAFRALARAAGVGELLEARGDALCRTSA